MGTQVVIGADERSTLEVPKRGEIFGIVGSDESQKQIMLDAILNLWHQTLSRIVVLGDESHGDLYGLIEQLRDSSSIVVIATSRFDLAEQVCDRVVLVAGGKIVALGSPYQLIEQVQSEQEIRFRVVGDFDRQILERLEVVNRVERRGDWIHVFGHGALRSMVVMVLGRMKIEMRDMWAVQFTLADVYEAIIGQLHEG